jgi:hypothetical protein
MTRCMPLFCLSVVLASAALIGQIEVWRLEHGRSPDQPRHAAIESGVPWPLLRS